MFAVPVATALPWPLLSWEYAVPDMVSSAELSEYLHTNSECVALNTLM